MVKKTKKYDVDELTVGYILEKVKTDGATDGSLPISIIEIYNTEVDLTHISADYYYTNYKIQRLWERNDAYNEFKKYVDDLKSIEYKDEAFQYIEDNNLNELVNNWYKGLRSEDAELEYNLRRWLTDFDNIEKWLYNIYEFDPYTDDPGEEFDSLAIGIRDRVENCSVTLNNISNYLFDDGEIYRFLIEGEL